MDDKHLTGSRIRKLRLDHRESQARIAEALGVDMQTVGRWERGENRAPRRHLEALASRWAVPPDYLAGDTDIADIAEFYLAEAARAESAEVRHLAEEQAKHERIKSLFQQCGFCYDDLSKSAVVDFAGIGGVNVEPHVLDALQQGRLFCLTDSASLGLPPTYFNQAELDALLEGLHSAVAFACFQQRERCEEEVSHDGDS